MNSGNPERFLSLLAQIDRSLLYLEKRAVTITLVYILLGLAQLAFSVALGIHLISFDGRLTDGSQIAGFTGPKDVGYALALNVSVVPILLVPPLLFVLLRARATMEILAEKLIDSGMVRKKTAPFEPCDRDEFLAAWRKHMSVGAVFGIFFSLGPITLMIYDLYDVIWRPLMAEQPIYEICPGLKLADDYPCNLFNTSIDLDWSIASLYPGGMSSKAGNLFFAALVYLLAPITGAFITFFSFAQFAFFGSFYSRASLDGMGIVITPNLDSQDSRLGFELFLKTFSYIFWSAVFVVIILFLGHVQNIYWRVPEARNIFEFYGLSQINALTNIKEVFAFFGEDLAETWSLERGNLLKTRQTIFAVMVVPMAFLTPLIFGYLVLYDTAFHGRKLMKKQLSEAANIDQKKLKKVEDMKVAPVAWTGLKGLWLPLLLIVSIAAYVLPRLIIIVAALLGVLALWEIFKIVRKRRRRP